MKLTSYLIFSLLIGVLNFSCKPKLTEKITIELSSSQLDSIRNNGGISQKYIDETLSILQNRLKQFGLFYDEDQFAIDSANSRRYTILLPEITNRNQLEAMLTTKGKMEIWKAIEFRDYHNFGKIIENDFFLEKVQRYLPGPVIACFKIEDKNSVMDTLKSIISSDRYQLRWGIDNKEEAGMTALYLLQASNPLKGPLITGETLVSSSVENNRGQYAVSMKMNESGAREWAKITEENVGNKLAIVVDDVVYSVPLVNQRIEGGYSSITGNFTKEEAQELAACLKWGDLPLKVTIVR